MLAAWRLGSLVRMLWIRFRCAEHRCRGRGGGTGSCDLGFNRRAAGEVELERMPEFLQQRLGHRAVVAIALELVDQRLLSGDALPGLDDVPIRLREGFSCCVHRPIEAQYVPVLHVPLEVRRSGVTSGAALESMLLVSMLLVGICSPG